MSRLIVTSILVQDPQPTNHNPQSPSVIFRAPFSWEEAGALRPIIAIICTKTNAINTVLQQRNTCMVPCPFLKNKGFCLKGSLCDFSHAHIYTITNRNSSFFEKRQDLVKRGCEVSKESRPISNKSHPGWISTGPLGRCKLCILRSVDLWW